MNTVFAVIIGILGLSFLVLFHETGHFVVALLCGVEVEAFSVGMGPVLLHKKIGKTDFRISLIPLGGYCAMKGEKDFEKALEENKKSIEGSPDSFYGISSFKRLLISFAGPFFNLIFAFIAFVIIAQMGYTYYSAGTTVLMADEVYEDVASPAHNAGMKSGDKILSLNGKEMNDFSDIAQMIALHGNEDIEVVILRDGQELTLTVHSDLDKDTGSGILGIVSDSSSVEEREYPALSFFPSLVEGAKQTISTTGTAIRSIGILFKGVNATKVVSGPARITTMLGENIQSAFAYDARVGVITALNFLALISISLFLTNLLPVPVLDGGLILVAIVEIITRRKASPKVLQNIQYVGIAIIALLFIFAVIGDFSYFFNL